MTMVGVDVGGTFTDVVSIDGGQITTVKVATDTVQAERSVIAGASQVGISGASVFNHASTYGLNAVITRALPKIAFLTTAGHRDILDAGRAWRPAEALTDPGWRRPFGDAARPLVPRYLRRTVDERIAADGHVVYALNEEQVRSQLAVLRDCDVQGVAICLLNAYVNPAHEIRVGELVKEELGDVACSISSNVSPLAKEYARASTTVIDVFMKLIYGSYTERLQTGLSELSFEGDLNYADCAAMLVPAGVAMEQPFKIVFSGPAAGTVAGAHFGTQVGVGELICCDIGGTSCDISMVTNNLAFVNTTFELEHDLIVNALSNEVSSIGAGGGSLVTISPTGELLVGPGSAGAHPGPACYGKGGKYPTMTDAFLLMGVIDPGTFAGGQMSLDAAEATRAFDELETQLTFDERVRYAFRVGTNHIAEGLIDVAVKHGVDPRDYSLLAYGAAGPMMLPSVLDVVHAREIIVPPHPGLFSALGLVSSDRVIADSQSAYTMIDSSNIAAIGAVYESMEARLRQMLEKHSYSDVRFERSLDARLLGQTWETPFVDVPNGVVDEEWIATVIQNFHDAYEQRSGNRFEAIPVQGVTYRVQAIIAADKVEYKEVPTRTGSPLEPRRSLELRYIGEGVVTANEYDRDDLCAGDELFGPAVIRERLSTALVMPSQRAWVGRLGEIHIHSV